LESSVGKVIPDNGRIFIFCSDETEIRHKKSSEEKKKNNISHKA
jgi:hypothetical protein